MTNVTNYTYIDQMIREGIIRASVQPYLDALGQGELLFYGILATGILGMSYMKTRDVYMPLLLLMVFGVTASTLLPAQLKMMGHVSIALAKSILGKEALK
jgi:hypothetical protein